MKGNMRTLAVFVISLATIFVMAAMASAVCPASRRASSSARTKSFWQKMP